MMKLWTLGRGGALLTATLLVQACAPEESGPEDPPSSSNAAETLNETPKATAIEAPDLGDDPAFSSTTEAPEDTGADDTAAAETPGEAVAGEAAAASETPAAALVTPEEPTESAGGDVVDRDGYSVAIARSGDTVASIAGRIGVGAEALASYNGLTPGHALDAGDELVLP